MPHYTFRGKDSGLSARQYAMSSRLRLRPGNNSVCTRWHFIRWSRLLQTSALTTLHMAVHSHSVAVAALHTPSDAHCVDLVPPLYEPQLVAAGNGILVLRGYERVDERAFVQEWHCPVQ